MPDPYSATTTADWCLPRHTRLLSRECEGLKMPVNQAVVDGDVADVAMVLQLLVEQELQNATYGPPPTPLLSSLIGSVVS